MRTQIIKLSEILLIGFFLFSTISADSKNSVVRTVNTELMGDGTEDEITAMTFPDDDHSDMLGQESATDSDYYDDYENVLPYAYRLTYNIIYIALAIFGTVGNVLITVTWSKVKQFNSTTFLLSFLGVCDFIFVFTMIFVQTLLIGVETFTYVNSWAFYLVVYISYVAQFASIFTTIVVSIARYVAVKFPFKVQVWFKKSTTKLLCAFLVLVSCLLSLPASTVACLYVYIFLPAGSDPLNYLNNVTTSKDSGRSGDDVITSGTNFPLFVSAGAQMSSTPSVFDPYDSLETSQDMRSMDPIEICFYTSKYEKMSLMVAVAFINIIPWTVVIPTNLLLINQVRQSFKDRKRIMSKDEQNNNTMDIVVIILTLQSIVAYPFFFVIELLTNEIDWEYYFGGEPPFGISNAQSMHATNLKDCLHILNSSVNIVAYCACGQRFRKLLLEDVLKCGATSKGQRAKPPKQNSVPSSSQLVSSVFRSTTGGVTQMSKANDSIGE